MIRIALAALCLLAATQPAQALCPGDCGGDNEVAVNELVTAVNVALGTGAIDQCRAADVNGDNMVTVNELIMAVNAALNGCSAGGFAGTYSGTVIFDATFRGTIQLDADEAGAIAGTMAVSSVRGRAGAGSGGALSFTFPVGGVLVPVSGTYDEAAGGFEVSGSFVDAMGQTVDVVISGNLPALDGSETVNVYVGTDVFQATLTPGTVTTPTATVVATPTPSPGPAGSEEIVFYGGPVDPHLYVMNADGSGKKSIADYLQSEPTTPAWSPDGTKIAVATHFKSGVAIAVIAASGTGGLQFLTTEDSPLNFAPAWSPNGSRIVFTSGGGNAIDVMNSDGSGRSRLVTRTAGERFGHLSWSPDGSKIAFEREPSSGSPEIYVMDADGTDLVPLTNNSTPDRYPAWSPDGSRILFSAQPPASAVNLYTMNPDGSGVTKITNEFLGASSPAWRADGQKIAYSNLLGLVIANANGSSPTTVPGTTGITDFDYR